MNTYLFKRFESKNSRVETRISITKSYDIGLSSGFYKQNGISGYQFAVLFFDDSKNALAVHFTNNKQETGLRRVSHDKKGMGARISATAFLKANNVEPKLYKGLYNWEKYEDKDNGTLYVVSLEKK